VAEAISGACDEVLAGQHDDQFPLSVWQTGSGTHSNMNVNEVIANRASEIMGGQRGNKAPVHPNDHVNLAQSSNDVFSAAVYVASTLVIKNRLLPSVRKLAESFDVHAGQWQSIVKSAGRT
jgi:fumarate hydratase class II